MLPPLLTGPTLPRFASIGRMRVILAGPSVSGRSPSDLLGERLPSVVTGRLGAMSVHVATIRHFWQATEARDWGAVAEVLAPEMVYEIQQTRERIRGRDAFLRFFDDYPGDWHLTLRRVIVDDRNGVSVLDFTVGVEQMLAITFFTFGDDGLITRVEDVWPEPYEPPPGREHLTERF